jgi:collagenase-like PrtC family protease
MLILSPLDSVEEVQPLAEAGAGEFYCGLLEEQWYTAYPVISINRRPAGKGHFRTFADVQRAVQRAHALGCKVYFALNEHYYIQAQYELIRRYAEGARDAGVDGFIIADFGLLAWLQEERMGVPLHISTGGTVFNRRAAAFYHGLGAQNITLPRHLALEELREVVRTMPPMDTTVFVLNSRCVNVDGLCTFQHGLAGKEIMPMYRNACMLPFDVQVHVSPGCAAPDAPLQQARVRRRQKLWEHVHVDDHPCGACALYEFSEMGITSVKVVGRGNPIERKVRDVAFLRQLLDALVHARPIRADFRRQARALYCATYRRACRPHMCYYPSVMEDNGV